jgi:hypothetical protein
MLAGRIAAVTPLCRRLCMDPQQAFAARYGFLYAYLASARQTAC